MIIFQFIPIFLISSFVIFYIKKNNFNTYIAKLLFILSVINIIIGLWLFVGFLNFLIDPTPNCPPECGG
jgi:hypothetical protein